MWVTLSFNIWINVECGTDMSSLSYFPRNSVKRFNGAFLALLCMFLPLVRAPVPDDLVCKHCKVNLLTAVNYVSF